MIQIKAHEKRLVEHGLLFKSLLSWAEVQPGAPFLTEVESERTLNYAQTLAAVCAMHQVLGNTSQRMMLMLPSGIFHALCWLSALSGGHHLIPISPETPEAEKAVLAARYQPDILIVEHEEAAAGFAYKEATVFTANLEEKLTLQTTQVLIPQEKEGFVSLTTSGSTGKAKGVRLSERQIAWTAQQVSASHELTQHDRGLTMLPFFHVNAPVVSLCASLLVGSSLVIARKFSRRKFWSWLEHHQITWVSIVPTIAAMLLETEKPAWLPGPLRFLRTGSASLSPAHLQAFEERFGVPLIETYGLSEAASQIVANPLPPALHKPGSAGLSTGVALRICSIRNDADNQPWRDVTPGEVGEVCIFGPGVIEAYEDGEEQNAFQDGWFRTGDLGYLDSDGYLFLKGRLREVINRGGENIAPRDIEEVLQSYPDVCEAVVVGRPDAIYGEQVVAYITARIPWNSRCNERLRHYLALHLTTPRMPIDLIVLDELPRNATGKIDRRFLRMREQARFREASQQDQQRSLA